MSVAFYRKYRSKKLSEIVGQDHITKILDLAIKNNKIAHAYLFSGPRGVGKTSIARILAYEIIKEPYNEKNTHPDIIEIDAASNNGVDNIRQLREQIQVAPFEAKYRIYIIDEVHMLSSSAFNALLKTLEEPPAHAIFILATTEAHKLPATIISRTQHFVFHYIDKQDITRHLKYIAEQEKINITDDALEIIAERGGGSFRDSISLLDQISSEHAEQITTKTLELALGITNATQIKKLLNAYIVQDVAEITNIIKTVKESGGDLIAFCDQLMNQILTKLPEAPHLAKLLLPLSEAKTSKFIDIEILVAFIDYSVAPSTVNIVNTNSEITITEVSEAEEEPIKIETTENSIKTDIQEVNETTKEVENISQEEPIKEVETKPKIVPKQNKKSSTTFNWTAFWQEAEKEYKGVGVILKKSSHVTNGDKLIIYVGNNFNYRQIDKQRAVLGKALKQLNQEHWQIEIIPAHKPPEDQMAAKVVEIMGGGEEVEANE